MSMLGRTAANLFWLSRYIERAENMSRLLDVGYRMSLTEQRDGNGSDHLVSMLRAAEMDEEFAALDKPANAANVAHFMLFDATNPSSVLSCLKQARTNARSERTSLTTDMWESLNSTWLEFSQIRPGQVTGSRLPEVLQWIRAASQRFRGALLGTILRNEGFAFLQAGTYVERGDNTARILDVKYYVLLPRANLLGSEIDMLQWTLILRAASAHRAYRHMYRERYQAWNIADFLILRPEMPRSLNYCAQHLSRSLATLQLLHGERGPAHDDAEGLLRMLAENDMDRIFKRGLHEFLTEFIERNGRLTETLSEAYNFY
ncbi:MAG TPA: alpha-E domain-containing protein [Devosiaceae bacterium]